MIMIYEKWNGRWLPLRVEPKLIAQWNYS